MKVADTFEAYKNDPFGFMDGLNLTFKNFNLNIFQKFRKARRIAFFVAILLGLLPWMAFGFDSCIGQPMMCAYNLPRFLSGELSWNGLVQIWNNHYGKEMHYSAFLIYGLMYWALSRHFDKNLGITKSKNVAYAASLTLFSVAIFEFYWMISYATFQAQPWVTALRWPQLRIILQNLAFFTVGVIAILYVWADSFKLREKEIVGRKYCFNWNLVSFGLIMLSVVSALLWVNYPLPVERFNVTLENGEVWSNTNSFPQTLYTIDLNPDDSVNAGVWFFKENNLVHGLNTLVKVLWTLSVFYVAKVKPVGGDKLGQEKNL